MEVEDRKNTESEYKQDFPQI